MPVHMYVFLLVVCLLLCLARLGRHDWLPLQPCASRGAAKRTMLHRLLKPRSPDDCPACRLGSTVSSGAEPGSAPVRPWREMKSRRGAPKRIETEGFACPNPQCRYFGNTDAQIHAAFRGWQAWSCRAHPDLSRSCLPHHLQCATRHPVVSSKDPHAPDRRSSVCAGRKAGPISCRAGLR